MIIANSAVSLLYLFASRSLPHMPSWSLPLLAAGGLFNVICAVALFRWKRWGFWGFVGSAIFAAVIYILIGLNPASVVRGLLGIGILYGILQIGKNNKGWAQLE
jgi:hypothetical protein